MEQRRVGGYVLEQEIGRGAMGVVHLGRHELGGWVRAIKQPLLALPDATTRLTFIHEAKLEGMMEHPNIVAVADVGLEQDGTPYIVMSYFELGALRSLVGRLTAQQVGRVVVDVLRGLDHAHQRGVIHRDIKPENLMRSENGQVCIADFGIARATDEARGVETLDGHVTGAVGYLAPEAVTKGIVSTAGDLYAVGVVTFELLAGAIPFAAETRGLDVEAAAHYKTTRSAPPLEQLVPDVDPDLAHWVAGLLHRGPEKRPASAREALESFEEIASRLWGTHWERGAVLPTGSDLPERKQEDLPSRSGFASWTRITEQAPVGELARHALLRPRNLLILGLAVLGSMNAVVSTGTARIPLILAGIAVLYLGASAVTFFDVAEADAVRRRLPGPVPAADDSPEPPPQ